MTSLKKKQSNNKTVAVDPVDREKLVTRVLINIVCEWNLSVRAIITFYKDFHTLANRLERPSNDMNLATFHENNFGTLHSTHAAFVVV